MNLSDNEKIIIVLGASGDTGKYFVNYFLAFLKMVPLLMVQFLPTL